MQHSASLQLRLIRKIGIPDTTGNPLVCMAAFNILHCSILIAGWAKSARSKKRGPKEKGRPKPAAPERSAEVRMPIPRRLCAADRARRNRGSPPPGDR
jgi:hypothetical protein